MRVDMADTGEARARAARPSIPIGVDCVVLDVMLPGIDGFAVAPALRAHAAGSLPILMLTARGRAEDVLRGFEAGADDYLPKPFELSILLARINALVRRHTWQRRRGQPRDDAPAANAPDVFTFADKTVDFDAQELRVRQGDASADADGDQSAALPRAARRPGRVAQEHARGRVEPARGHGHARDRSLHRAAAEVHREGTRKPTHLLTVRGVGYKFVAAPKK